MDALKRAVADAVWNAVRERAGDVPVPVERLEVKRVTPLEFTIRVASGDQRGPRYFNIRVSESI